MKFTRTVRRLHLYLGLFLLSWFVMYAIGGLVFSHGSYFGKWYQDGKPDWTVRFDRPYDRPVPQDAELRPLAKQILEDAGLKGCFGVHRPNQRQLKVWVFSFLSRTRLTYFVDQKRLLAEDQRFRWDHFFTGMHARGGFQQEWILADAWGVVVDLICTGIVLWVISGVYMWWKVRRLRFWGTIALGGGVLCFVVFLAVL